MQTAATLIELGRAEERERIAKMVDDFSWTLPMYNSQAENEASDDAAEGVRAQIAAAIRALNK
jgi:NAD(P)H-dependent FMN reductase